MDARYYPRIYLTTGLIALIVLSLLGYSYYSSNRMVSVHAPLGHAIEGIMEETATAHLWVEEILNGENEHNMDEVSWLLDEADWYAQALLEGGKDSKTKYIPVHNHFLRKQIQELRDRLAALREITEERYESDDASGEGTEIEQYYDEIFNALNDQAEKVVEQSHQIINRDVKRHRSAQSILVVISLFLFMLIGFLFYDHQNSLREHARHLEKEVAEHKQAEKALQQSEARYRELYDENPSMFFTVDPLGKVLSVNRYGADQLGYTRDELTGTPVIDIFYKEDKKAVLPQLEKCVANPDVTHNWELRKVKRDGTIISVRETAHVIAGIDGSSKILIVCEDITERKQAEKKLQATYSELNKSQKQIRAILDNSPALIYLKDLDGRQLMVNNKWQSILGLTEKEVIGHTDYEIFGSEATEQFMANDRKVITSMSTLEFEEEVALADGIHTYISYKFPLLDESGQPYALCGISSDITARKRAEEKLQASEEKYRLIMNFAGEGIYGLDADGHTTFCNPAAARMVGWTPDEMIGKPQHSILHHTRADGKPYPRSECPIYAAFKDGKVHHVVNELFWRKDGTSFPVEYTSTPIRKDDVLIGAVVVFMDITARKRVEVALQDSEIRFRVLAQSAQDVIITANSAGMIVGWNLSAERIFGYSQAEAFGQPLTLIIPPQFHEGHCDGITRIQAGGEARVIGKTVELTGLRKDGSEFPLELSLSRGEIPDDYFFTAIIRDITERKQTEEELQRYSDELTKKNEELQEALANVNALSGMLPICAYCKKIRDDQGYWNQLESYISLRSETQFSHGICPECKHEEMEKLKNRKT